LDMLHARPLAGRLLLPSDAEPGAPPVAMVTEQAWRRLFGSDPNIIGRVLMFGREPSPTTIVGILPAGARIDATVVPDFLTVLAREYARGAPVSVLARMRPGITPEAVASELRAIPRNDPVDSLSRVPDVARPATLALGETFSRDVWLAFAGALALFVISVVNAGHLLLGRAMARDHELGVRRAIGGSSARIARLFLTEAFVYAGSGLALGIGIMIALERLIGEYEPRLFMEVAGSGLHGRTVWILGGGAAIAMLACSVAPMLRSRSRDLRTTMDAGSLRSTSQASRAMHAFTVVQAAIAVLLVVGAAVMARSLGHLMAVDSGMAIDHLVSLAATPPATRYSTRDKRAAYRDRVEATLRAIPTVTGVTTSYTALLNMSAEDGLPYLDGEVEPPARGSSFGLARVPPNYFDVTGTRVIAGRPFRADDLQDAAIVNESFAAAHGGNVVGRLLHTPGESRAFRIVGVASNVKSFGLADTKARYQAYVCQPHSNTSMFVRFFVRTSGDPAVVIQEARRRIAAIDPTIPIEEPHTGADVIRGQTAPFRFAAALLCGFAILGLGLALSGIYGSVALAVSRRTREIGIRMALGATPRRVLLAVIATGLRPVLLGGIVGVAGAWFALPLVNALLYDVKSTDPWSSAVSLSVVTAAATFASWIPARRASRVDPVTALRCE
ncbi:MAG: ABC transporter permease, partial [Vicinamibacterales bacterium]